MVAGGRRIQRRTRGAGRKRSPRPLICSAATVWVSSGRTYTVWLMQNSRALCWTRRRGIPRHMMLYT